MKQIQAEGEEGYMHIFGEFEHVRKQYGDQVVHEPLWAINIFYTETSAKPLPGAVEDDRIEVWWGNIIIAQDGGFVFHADADRPYGKDFHIGTTLPLAEPIHIFHVHGDPATITGKEEQE